jgi:hypothetical protein
VKDECLGLVSGTTGVSLNEVAAADVEEEQAHGVAPFGISTPIRRPRDGRSREMSRRDEAIEFAGCATPATPKGR